MHVYVFVEQEIHVSFCFVFSVKLEITLCTESTVGCDVFKVSRMEKVRNRHCGKWGRES